ncbi:MAG TPA: PLP-dependent aminotransferase family protein [Thermoanaerobaculia bacterium]
MIEKFLSADARNLRPSAIRALAKWINDPNVISFAGGSPNPETFPAERFAVIADRVLRERRNVSLQYGPTRGLPRLCEFVAALSKAKTEEVILTTGSQQALDLIAHTLLDAGDIVAVELPTYIGGTSSFYARSATMAGVAQDDDGIVPESLAEVAKRKRIKFLYTIPNFQNPSGRLMTQRRREQVLEIAKRHDFLIVEDDPYGELVYVENADTTPIKSRDLDGRVLYLGTFSKVLAPGVRCGWIVGPKSFIDRVEIAKQAADLCSGMLDQSIIDEYCNAGELPAQIERVRAFYRGKRAIMLDALERHFEGRAQWTAASGGLFTFMTLKDAIDTTTRVEKAIATGVAYVPGSPFFVDGSGQNTMRLTFAKESDERLREGVRRLASVFA